MDRLEMRPRLMGWINKLSETHPVFHSEADFQFALSRVMSADGVGHLRLERRHHLSGPPLQSRRHLNIDIMGRIGDQRIALELKYPKKSFTGTVLIEGEPEEFDLPSGGAFDLDAAAIWRDAERIERLLADDVIDAGAAVTLSNYPLWSDASLGVGTKAYAFRLWEGRRLSQEVLAWDSAAPGPEQGAVSITSTYVCNWLDYSNPTGQTGQSQLFRYLILEPV